MKIVIKNIIVLAFFCGLVACDSMNSIHEEYLDRGEEIYTGVIDSLKAYPGNERVKFTWEINADPRITKTVIYWNDSADSVIVEVNRTQPGVMQMETILSLPEDSYIFKFVTNDDEGHKSLSVEKTVEIYGPDYAAMLRNREIKSITAPEEGGILLTWGAIEDATLIHTMISYTDYSNPSHPEKVEVMIENNVSEWNLANVKEGDEILVSSVYQPEDCLDMFNAKATVYHIPARE